MKSRQGRYEKWNKITKNTFDYVEYIHKSKFMKLSRRDKILVERKMIGF